MTESGERAAAGQHDVRLPGVQPAEGDGGLAAWMESRRLSAGPRHTAEMLRRKEPEDDPLEQYYDEHAYDSVTDPQTFAVVRAQQRAAGQRHRRLRRLARRRDHGD